MNDAISRCELFNKLATIPAPPEANEFKAEVYKIIQQMETSEKWIPCSERLPNDGDRIVVQYANGDSGVINSCRMRLWNIINSPYATVVAWMPLPEPWKGTGDA